MRRERWSEEREERERVYTNLETRKKKMKMKMDRVTCVWEGDEEAADPGSYREIHRQVQSKKDLRGIWYAYIHYTYIITYIHTYIHKVAVYLHPNHKDAFQVRDSSQRFRRRMRSAASDLLSKKSTQVFDSPTLRASLSPVARLSDYISLTNSRQ